ncbi:MBL fold metallo-hydrolase [Nocardioides psychrotolerans]|uniref:Phosphoribosyl 1,2-cyclic phosphodiesterase n=1 Tax=Nocardioides psychrotolerans TaxID=1005945 RepID=A0A1I3NPX9_9ACTN|nr:MBL fold metallo-hydrolase [Nocardioides psychrotolerans]GEP39387.1 MBL fold metallo-hydrolase [Nocardioides psychrotolerans]SFJ11167.1 Phosphoribosyl 1,2-cyclic phosphodiesterase [Nocardioides psychrotolerans]
MRVTFCGVRGSTPAPGADFLRYGGHTSSVAFSIDEQAAPDLVVDAGTGLTAVTTLLGGQPYAGSILLGHLHWDHTHGLPFFAGGTAAGSRVAIHLPAQGDGESAEQVLERCFSPPHFPVVPSALGAGWSFHGLEEGRHRIEAYDVLAREIPHKGGRSLGYRVSHGGASLAYVCDHSPTAWGPGPDGLGARHDNVLDLARDADVMIHDAQHRAAQFPGVDFLGHASAEYAVELAREAGVRTLVLFHHAPDRTDDQVDEILADARLLAGDDLVVLAAHEGMVLDLP